MTKKTVTNKKKYYKTIYTIELLTEDPMPDPVDIETIHYEMSEGRASGMFKETKVETLSGPEMAKALIAQGSDPEFLFLNEDGEDIYDG